MALQYSTAVRIARLDAVESTIGASALLTIRTGAPPSNCGAANSGTVLATINLPSDWMAAASAAGNVVTKAMTGTWQDASADASGTAAHFRIHDTAGTTCHMQAGDETRLKKLSRASQSSGCRSPPRPVEWKTGVARRRLLSPRPLISLPERGGSRY